MTYEKKQKNTIHSQKTEQSKVNNPKMYEVLKLVYVDFKAAMIAVLSEVKENILEMNEKTER